MKFEVYCDESRQDLFASRAEQRDKYLLIGGLWLPAEMREEIKSKIHGLKERFSIHGEIKWQKVSPARVEFYRHLADLFVECGPSLRFRCIAVEAQKVNLVKYHENDQELGFYKFYYQLIHHWILDFNEYAIFCDIKTARRGDRLTVLRRCLEYSNLSSRVPSVQALPSSEVGLIQLADFLLGTAGSRLNNSVKIGGAKDQVIKHLEQRLGVVRLQHTPKSEQKFNIFVIQLEGGW